MGIERVFNKVIDIPDADLCPHLKMGDVAPVITIVSDSCGTIEINASCADCHKSNVEAAENLTDYCNDCDGEFKVKDLLYFSYWGDASEDPPIPVCPNCCEGKTHRRRVRESNRLKALDMADEDDE